MAEVTEFSVAETKRLAKDLLSSLSNVNNAALLLSILSSRGRAPSSSIPAEPTSPEIQCRLEALRSLHAFFIPLLRSGKFVSEARKKVKQVIGIDGTKSKDAQGEHPSEEESDSARAEAVYRSWVWNKFREFKKSLFRIIAQRNSPQILKVVAINTVMDLVREERTGTFNNSLYLKLCARIFGSRGQTNEILELLIAKYFKYSDVKYFTYCNIEKLVTKRLELKHKGDEVLSSDEDDNLEDVGISLHAFTRNVYDVLSHLPPPKEKQKDEDVAEELWALPDYGGDQTKGVSEAGQETLAKDKVISSHKNLRRLNEVKRQKSSFGKAWLSFLQLSLPLDIYKKVLARLPTTVIPFLTNPIRLSDFLTDSYNTGGLISVMALSSMFLLITNYGLEYPEFYNKLYALLEPSIFVARYRARFFELLDTCLKSPHLPGYMGAAFAKRLGRLVLSAPPSGAIVVIALIHNLLRRHPSINVLVHRPESSNAITVSSVEEGHDHKEDGDVDEHKVPEGRLGADPFVASESDTSKSNALKSSLWEIESLRRHYCPAVSRFVESLETDLTVRAKTTEFGIRDFSSASYATIFGEEVGRRLNRVPLSFYSVVPNRLFPEGNSDSSFNGWNFEETLGVTNEIKDSTKSLEQTNNNISDEMGRGDSSESMQSDDISSDGSGDSRSRSEQSEGEGWPPPLAKRLKAIANLQST